MKITLLKNLDYAGVEYKSGEEVDLPSEVYQWLVSSYVRDRQLEREAIARQEEVLLEKAKQESRRGRK